jgi:hypothetical protein
MGKGFPLFGGTGCKKQNNQDEHTFFHREYNK